MKKIICFLLVLIIILTPLNFVRATEAIELTQASFDLLNNGVDLLSYSGSVPYGFLPFVFSSEKNYQNVLEDLMQKEDVFIIDGNANIQIRPLTENEYGLLENAYVYDVYGDVVSLSELYFGTVDNGYFTEKFYCKNDGSIVYQDSLKENPYIDVKFGGSELSYVDWENAYDSLSDYLNSNSYNYNLNGGSLPNLFYFAHTGYVTSRVRVEGWIFVPNMYDVGHISISSTQPQNQSAIFYYNDGAIFYYANILSDGYYNRSGTNTINGVTYTHYIQPNGVVNSNSNSSRTDFNNRVSGAYNFSETVFNYDTSLLSSNYNIVSYKKVLTNADTLDLSKSYSYSAVLDYSDTIDGINGGINTSFDSSNDITDLNYPLIYEIDNSISDVVVPFPDSIAIDDSPAIDYPLEDTIDPSLITSNIPIISDLKNKFPFSIPWDIANLLKGLEAQRTTPYIDTNVTIPGVNYTWHIEYDLSDFDSTAELFRTLFLIAFIIGLAYFSYDHFFGS